MSRDAAHPPFHLAFPVRDLAQTRRFYGEVLGLVEGRSAERWIDYDLAGHQLSAHLVEEVDGVATNAVDGDDVPVRHFGLVLEWEAWERMAERLRAALAERGERFLIEPHVRFAGEVGEQGTFFVVDPSGNALEFKAFRDPGRLFAR